jgi:hypothetical protein
MADLSVFAWASLKWLITCSLIAIVVFQRTIHASIRKLLDPTHQTTNSKPAMDPRPRDMHDIYHTVFLLQRKLVRDVIPAIIEYAELYECTTSENRFYPIQQISQYQAPKQLLVCEIPKPTARVQRPVRKIVFRINSHDQGFASDRDGGSWTWFTAQKIPSTASEDCQSEPTDSTATLAADDEHREIFRNPIASRNWFTHEIVWRANSEDTAEAEWVSSLEEGDRFAVHAWARFPAWVNHVSDISVKVYTVAVA